MIVIVAGCGIDSHAEIELIAPDLGEARGFFSVDEVDGGVRIHGDISDVPPGRHGVHVHAGACDGPHFDPGGQPHGGLDDAASHAGDLGNIEVDADGRGSLDVTVSKLTYGYEGRGLLDRRLSISAAEDDGTTQPDGDSGAPILCGRIAIPGE